MARVLVIDDEEPMREMLQEAFEDDGYDVSVACDGVEGVKAFRDNPADLVVTDIIMPNKEGIQVIWELKAEAPDLKIIAISGGNLDESQSDLPLAESFGASKSIQKPFSISEILRVAGELLN
ncbi:MAG: response regulator [Candidatus Binatia bacterium]